VAPPPVKLPRTWIFHSVSAQITVNYFRALNPVSHKPPQWPEGAILHCNKGSLLMSRCAQNAAEPADMEKGHHLTIKTVARMFDVSTLALRVYEFRGLIRRKRAGRERVYSWSDCERIALIVKARKAGLAMGPLAWVIRAMDDKAPYRVTDAGRRACLALIHGLENRQARIGDVLGELHRIDWELSERRGGRDSPAREAAVDRA
jgi:DNA-binding transcriptional MerR regulator